MRDSIARLGEIRVGRERDRERLEKGRVLGKWGLGVQGQ